MMVESTPRRPNVLIVLADDLGYSDFGCYGSEIRTPHIDKTGKRGIEISATVSRSVSSRVAPSVLLG